MMRWQSIVHLTLDLLSMCMMFSLSPLSDTLVYIHPLLEWLILCCNTGKLIQVFFIYRLADMF
ncbi:hypothetical protein BC941DRAFT_407466 [Chlamydoabsidia padenii]|nr:hypothetical protein BC941DRAFT_407466 [Chlamydoabsidia padenii]